MEKNDSSDNTAIHYEYLMSSNNNVTDTVLLVHGIGLDLTIWDDVLPILRQTYHVLRIDLPGHGKSAELTDKLSWELLTDAVQRLLQSLSIEQVHLIGHSGGGNLGIELVLSNPAFIQSLTLIATPIFIPKEIGKEESVNRISKAKTGKIEEIVAPIVGNLCFPSTEAKTEKLFNIYKQVSVTTYLSYFKLYFDKVITYSLELETLAQLNIPMMMLVGENDSLYPPKLQMLNTGYLDQLKFYIIPNSSNIVMMDQPEVFVQFIRQFIKGTKVPIKVSNHYFYSNALNKEINIIVETSIQQIDSKSMIKINMLKTFNVIINGKEVIGKWNQRKARQIITYLALHKSVTRDQLIDIFWVNHDLKKARNQLRVALNHIKGMIEGHTGIDINNYISIGRDIIELTVNVKIDVMDLLSILDEIEEEKDVYLKLSKVMEHINNIPDVIFPSFYEDWVLELRSSIERRIIDICEGMLKQRLQEPYQIELLKFLIRFNPTEIHYYDMILFLLQKGNRQKEIEYFEQKRQLQIMDN